MATTTARTIRERQQTQIMALSPSSLANVRFEAYSRAEPFEEWAESADRAAFRKFHIQDLATYELPLGGDVVSEEVTTQFLVTVAYPLDNRFGIQGTDDLEDCINADRRKIQNAIGIHGYGSYVSGHQLCREAGAEIDRDGEKVWFLRLTFDINFRQSIT